MWLIYTMKILNLQIEDESKMRIKYNLKPWINAYEKNIRFNFFDIVYKKLQSSNFESKLKDKHANHLWDYKYKLKLYDKRRTKCASNTSSFRWTLFLRSFTATPWISQNWTKLHYWDLDSLTFSASCKPWYP